MVRIDGRRNDEIRAVSISVGYQRFAEGSALIELGETRVLCSASVEERVPNFLKGQGKGWITAEYAMLPRATIARTPRESTLGRIGGRTSEIQRLIGRSLRAVTNLNALGERTVLLDCDVLQADGGTRTAAITGAYVALYKALSELVYARILLELPLQDSVAAVSVGLVDGLPLLDLCYEEDSRAEVDCNIAMTGDGRLVEVQGSAERNPYSIQTLLGFVDLAKAGIGQIKKAQASAIDNIEKHS